MIITAGSDVGMIITARPDVGMIITAGSDVGMIITARSDVGMIITAGSVVGMVITAGSQSHELFRDNITIGEVCHGFIEGSDVQFYTFVLVAVWLCYTYLVTWMISVLLVHQDKFC